MSLVKVNEHELAMSFNFVKPEVLQKGGRRDKSTKGLMFTIGRYIPSEHSNPDRTKSRRIVISSDLANLLRSRYSNSDYSKIKINTKTNKQEQLFKLAFSLGGGEENFCVLNPTGGIAFFPARVTAGGGELQQSTSLIEKLYDTYNVDRKTIFRWYIRLEYLHSLKGLDIYRMIKQF